MKSQPQDVGVCLIALCSPTNIQGNEWLHLIDNIVQYIHFMMLVSLELKYQHKCSVKGQMINAFKAKIVSLT